MIGAAAKLARALRWRVPLLRAKALAALLTVAVQVEDDGIRFCRGAYLTYLGRFAF